MSSNLKSGGWYEAMLADESFCFIFEKGPACTLQKYLKCAHHIINIYIILTTVLEI